jgi:membrane-associated protease RseP (regulator of RpoE activity)
LQQPLDRVASCAAVSLGVPLGSVSMVDANAVTLVGMHGFERRRTVRAGSFCDAVVQLRSPLLVADAAADERFRGHEFVAVGGVRSYAGAPLKGPQGGVVGAVAAYAGEPDRFRPSALDDLEALAHMVELLLEQSGPIAVELPRLRRQGWIGVRTLDARRAGTAARAGLVVLSVARGSPAEQSGLRPTDILYEVDGQLLRERADLVAALADREPGSSARITVQRAGKWLDKWVPVATRQSSRVTRHPRA